LWDYLTLGYANYTGELGNVREILSLKVGYAY